MAKPSQSNKKHIFYNPNIKRKKSGDKYKKLINRFITLLKREKVEGSTLRLKDAFVRTRAQMKAYGISLEIVNNTIEHKGLKDLIVKDKTR